MGFMGSKKYWINRYEMGGNSGRGSFGREAEFKAGIINNFIKEENIKDVIDYGCGNGDQLRLIKCPKYLGYEIAYMALLKCRDFFRNDNTKTFKIMEDYVGETAELTLSLDVIYHLIEDEIFEFYMKRLFNSSTRFVIIYSTNMDRQKWIQAPHIRHRKFALWIDKYMSNWKLNKSFANFYIYQKMQSNWEV